MRCDNCKANGICDGIIGDCNESDKTADRLYKKGRSDAIDECIKFLTDYFGVAEAKKYGNKTREQYNTWMNYEIKQGIEELEGLKELRGKDINVTTTEEGDPNEK